MPSVNHTIVRSNHTQTRGWYFVTGKRAKIVRERMDGVCINDGVKRYYYKKILPQTCCNRVEFQ